MSSDLHSIIRNNPKYAELVRRRARFSWMLTATMLSIYFGYIALIAAEPQLKLLGMHLFAGSVITVGLPVGVGVILSAITLTGVYVYRANTEFDNLIKQLIGGSK